MEGYRFDSDNHLHLVDGKPVVSVTSAMRGLLFDPTKYREGAADRGTRVHDGLELWDLYGEETSDLEVLPYLAAWRRFRDEKGFKPEQVEYACCSRKFGYAGVIDRIGSTLEFPRILLDIKSGGKEPWHRIQTAAYAAMLATPLELERWGVYVRDNGTYEIEIHPRIEWHSDFSIFLSCLSIHNWKERNGNRYYW